MPQRRPPHLPHPHPRPALPDRPPLQLEISSPASGGRRLVAPLKRRLREACRLIRPPMRELSIALVDDGQMAKLHAQFLGIAGPTDVLTFELEHDDRNRVIAGEIVVCIPEARRQAAARGVKIADEVLLYALHGMLHLSGFDDRTERGFRAMHRREDQILTALGVGPVFNRPPPSRTRRGVGAE